MSTGLGGCELGRPDPVRRANYLRYQREHAEKIHSYGQEAAAPLGGSLEEIRRYLEEHHRPYSELLQPGLGREEIARLLGEAGLEPLEEIYELYSWRNGQRVSPVHREPEFIPGLRLLPLPDAIAQYRLLASVTGAYRSTLWGESHLPILNWQDSWHAVACAGERRGTVYQLLLESPEPSVAHSSLAAFMDEEAACYREGAYYVSDEGLLTSDDTRRAAIFARYHPRLEYRGSFVERSRREEPRDDGGKVVHIEYEKGLTGEQIFAADGRLLSQTDRWRGGRTWQSFTNTYDQEGRLRTRRYEEGTSVLWRYGPDAEVTIVHTYPDGEEVRRGTLREGGRPAIRAVEWRPR